MNLQKGFGYVWVLAVFVFSGVYAWQEFPIVMATHQLGYRDMMRLQLAVLLRPANLAIWAVLVLTGIVTTWRMRSIWREDRRVMYVFVACSFSVVWFFAILLFVR